MRQITVMTGPERRQRWNDENGSRFCAKAFAPRPAFWLWRVGTIFHGALHVAQQAAAAAALTEFAEAVVDDGEQQNAHQAAMPVIIVDLGGKGRVSISRRHQLPWCRQRSSPTMIPAGARVWIAMGHTDMRRGMQELAAMVQQASRETIAGDLWVFRGRSGALVKIIWHDGLRMSLYSKRLERGSSFGPPRRTAWCRLTSRLACLLDEWTAELI
jgi:transposase